MSKFKLQNFKSIVGEKKPAFLEMGEIGNGLFWQAQKCGVLIWSSWTYKCRRVEIVKPGHYYGRPRYFG